MLISTLIIESKILSIDDAKFNIKSINVGSPPLTRDKSKLQTGTPGKYGITPAYAGQIEDQNEKIDIQWDHPRLRGTN